MREICMRSLLLVLLLAASVEAQTAVRPCSRMAQLATPGVAITKAEVVPAGLAPAPPGAPGGSGFNLPAYCRVEGIIDQRMGVNGKPYGSGFALALPDKWNGGFLFQGGGGLNGNVAQPVGAQAAGELPALARGFAVVTTAKPLASAGTSPAAWRPKGCATLPFNPPPP